MIGALENELVGDSEPVGELAGVLRNVLEDGSMSIMVGELAGVLRNALEDGWIGILVHVGESVLVGVLRNELVNGLMGVLGDNIVECMLLESLVEDVLQHLLQQPSLHLGVQH